MRRLTHPLTILSTLALLLALPAWPGVEAAAQASSRSQAQPPAAAQAAPPTQAKPPSKSELPAVRNFTRVDASFACGGALSPEGMAAVKQAGFKSVVNLRTAGEEGVDIEAATKAAQAAGLKYIWLPFQRDSPDATKVDEFLKAVVDPENQPMLIHCASGGRVSMFWAIKRVMLDGWPVEKAMAELPELSSNVHPALKAFALEYLKQHGK